VESRRLGALPRALLRGTDVISAGRPAVTLIGKAAHVGGVTGRSIRLGL